MLDISYNFIGRNRSILIIVTFLGGFLSPFFYLFLSPNSPVNNEYINIGITCLYFIMFLVLLLKKQPSFIDKFEIFYLTVSCFVFVYNVAVVFSHYYVTGYVSILLVLLVSLVFSLSKNSYQNIYLVFTSVSFILGYVYFDVKEINLIILFFMLTGVIWVYLFLTNQAISEVSVLSFNFENFLNNELSGYVFFDPRKQKLIWHNKKAKELYPELDYKLFQNIYEDEIIEYGDLKFSVILKKHRSLVIRIDDISREKDSIHKYNHIFSQNMAGVYETSLDGTILLANDSFAKMFGYEKSKDVIQLNAGSFYQNPKEREVFLELIKKEKRLTNYETIQLDKNGKRFYALNNIIYNSKNKTLNGIIIEITAQKQHEQKLVEEKERSKIDSNNQDLKLKGIFEGLKNVRVYTLNRDYEVLSFNSTSSSFFTQFFNRELEKGLSFLEIWSECFTDEYATEIRSIVDLAFNGEGQYSKAKLKNKEREYWIESYINPIYSSEGKIKEVSIINHDITEKQEYEKKLKDSLEEKDVLLKEVHHRVKNNLQVISSILNLQTNYVDDPKVETILSESQNRIKTMSFIHESLYQTKNFVEIRFSEHLDKLINNLVYSYSIEPDIITITKELEDLSLNLDIAIPLGLIVNEIISNALKHAFEINQNGEVKISMKTIDKTIHLEISDNGKGIENIENIEETNTLGLQLILTLVDQIDGRISIENKNGTKFLIIFTP